MEILQLKYFKDAAIFENFSKVAELYMVPPSSVSHTISRLEDELGIKLFTRNGNKVFLNEAGEIFYNEVNNSLSKLENGIELLKKRRTASIRISLIQAVIPSICAISEFKKQNPDIEFTFSNPTDRAKGNVFFDILVSTKPFLNENDYTSLRLFEERILAAVSIDSPLANKKALNIDNIRGIPVIGLYPNSKMHRLMSGYFERNEYSPNIIVESEDRPTMLEFVRGDLGIAFYPEKSWYNERFEGIASLPISDFDYKRTVYISWPKEYEPSDAAKKLIAFMTRWFDK